MMFLYVVTGHVLVAEEGGLSMAKECTFAGLIDGPCQYGWRYLGPSTNRQDYIVRRVPAILRQTRPFLSDFSEGAGVQLLLLQLNEDIYQNWRNC